jgi:hypothetical protein
LAVSSPVNATSISWPGLRASVTESREPALFDDGGDGVAQTAGQHQVVVEGAVVEQGDKHRIRPDGKPGWPVRDERGEMLDVDVGVDTMAPEGFDGCREGRSPIGTASPGAR